MELGHGQQQLDSQLGELRMASPGKSMRARDLQHGVSLIETLIAVLIAVVGVFSVGGLIFQGTVTNKNQGTEVTRATIYAQDKIEKLLSFGAE